MNSKNSEKGFGVIGIMITMLVIVVLGFTGYLVWNRSNNKSGSTDSSVSKTDTTKSLSSDSPPAKDPNEGFFLVKEWGLRFKVPPSIFDIRYKIVGDTLAFYAKPTGLKYDYVKDYDQISDLGFPSLAVGVVYRSKEINVKARGLDVEGKKVGDYYYHTAWSFSSIATGAACLPLYDMPNQQEQCDENGKAFKFVNQELIKSIELIQ